MLLSQVRSELDGSQPITRAGVVFDAHDPATQLDEATDLYTALAVLRLAGLASPDRS